MADDRLIVALDVSTMEEVRALVETLGDAVSFYKVGMQLYYQVGTEVLTYLRRQGKRVFLDLKLHDIPNTVAHGVQSLLPHGFQFLTLHGQGGRAMMEAAVAMAREEAAALQVPRPQLLAITVLTSFDDASWEEVGGTLPIADRAVALARLAQEAGMDGIVASAQEAPRIRAACGPDFLIVTPGIRPAFAAVNDQKRIATPSSALSEGATHLVVGRPITQASDPKEAATRIVVEMEAH